MVKITHKFGQERTGMKRNFWKHCLFFSPLIWSSYLKNKKRVQLSGDSLPKFNHEMTNAQRVKLFIKDFFSKCDQICSFLRSWSHLLKKSLIKSFFLCSALLLPLPSCSYPARSSYVNDDKYVAKKHLVRKT